MKHDLKAVIDVEIKASRAKVWDALTNPSTIKKYFFGTDLHTDWKPGSSIRFTGEWQGKRYEDKGTVLEFEEQKRLQYTYWSSMSGKADEPDNYMVITYELAGKDGDLHLKLTQENIPDEATKEHSTQNWKGVMDEMKKLVEA
ncbi:MAG: SRPBCC domain-containing protein [Chitinophagaceae bacterium]|nr:MAG: SRPBCC domain-containing protein [Chitinophagaceae bacterium]